MIVEKITSITKEKNMTTKPNFCPCLKEPLLPNGESGFAIEIEFHEQISGLKGDTIFIYLTEEATLENATDLIGMLKEFCSSIKITNPK
jgi:hypothetical protein